MITLKAGYVGGSVALTFWMFDGNFSLNSYEVYELGESSRKIKAEGSSLAIFATLNQVKYQ